MNPWNESFELLKSIEYSSDLNKGPTGPIVSFIKKIFGKLFGSSNKPRINPRAQTSRIRRKSTKSDTRISKEKNFQEDYDTGQELINRNPNAQLNFDQNMAVQHKGVLPKNPDFQVRSDKAAGHVPTTTKAGPKIKRRRLGRGEIEKLRDLKAESAKNKDIP